MLLTKFLQHRKFLVDCSSKKEKKEHAVVESNMSVSLSVCLGAMAAGTETQNQSPGTNLWSSSIGLDILLLPHTISMNPPRKMYRVRARISHLVKHSETEEFICHINVSFFQ